MSSDVRLIMNLIPDRSKHSGEKVPGTVNRGMGTLWGRPVAFLFFGILTPIPTFSA